MQFAVKLNFMSINLNESCKIMSITFLLLICNILFECNYCINMICLYEIINPVQMNKELLHMIFI